MSDISGVEDWARLPVSADNTALAFESIDNSQCAEAATLKQIVQLLASPDTGTRLHLFNSGLRSSETGEAFRMHGARPLLLPKYARDLIHGNAYELSAASNAQPGAQYLTLSNIKMQGGPQNSDYRDIWFQRHVYRSRRLLRSAEGLVLDIGCDKPSISRRLFPGTATFLGLEPSLEVSDEFCLCGMAEHLPLVTASVDNVAFMTSLDHILDYQLAVDEAERVLKPGGRFFLASLVWTDRASLVSDTVHFHHFRDFELLGAMRGLQIVNIERYDWKSDTHRFGVYVEARKPS
jgi:SAM-dependent methyltransferase